MKLIVTLPFGSDAQSSHVLGTVAKEWECDATPVPGMELQDPVWDEPREIKSVILNPDAQHYHIYVGLEKCRDGEHFQQLVDMYESHGWRSTARG